MHELELDLVDRLLDEDRSSRRGRRPSSLRGALLWISATLARTAVATATAFVPRCLRTPSAWSGTPSRRAIDVASAKPSSTIADVLEVDAARGFDPS